MAATREPRINDRIRAREVRLVSADGEQIGIRPLPEALGIALDEGLDLVEVADKANPPVCRIMDYGKYKYEIAQREKESRKKSSKVPLKEMKYRPKIGQGDFDTKTRKVEKFLKEGSKVKVTIMFRGREMQHPDLGRKILERVEETVAHVGMVEIRPSLDGRNMVMVMAPDKKAIAELIKAEAAAEADEDAVEAGIDPTTDTTDAAAEAATEAVEPADADTTDAATEEQADAEPAPPEPTTDTSDAETTAS